MIMLFHEGESQLLQKRSLRQAQPWMIKKVPIIKIGRNICDSCRKKIAKTTHDSSESDEDETVVFKDDVTESVETVNLCLYVIGETPICQRKFQQVKYPKEKLNKIKLAMKKCLETFVRPVKEFIECFCDRLEALLLHSFIAKKHSSFQLELEGSLMPDEFLVLANFLKIIPSFSSRLSLEQHSSNHPPICNLLQRFG